MDDARLDVLRRHGDRPADTIVRDLAEGGSLWSVNTLLARVATPVDALPEALPPALRAFLARGARLPAWAEPDRIARAQAFAERHLIHVVTALFCASLPAAYAAARGARVLAATQRMERDVDRRVNETGRFVLDVLAPGGLSEQGRGVRAAQKVRLLHACIRHHVTALDGAPPAEEVPINQEDLLGTLFSFSVVVLDALARMGVAATASEEQDYYHLWRVVGHLLGIRERVLPADVVAARALAERIAERQVAPSAEGRRLAATLLEAMDRHLVLPALRGAPRRLVVHLVGARVAGVLGVGDDPASPELAWLARGAALLGLSAYAPRVLTGLSGLVGHRLLEGLMAVKLQRTTPTFVLPRALGERWDLSST